MKVMPSSGSGPFMAAQIGSAISAFVACRAITAKTGDAARQSNSSGVGQRARWFRFPFSMAIVILPFLFLRSLPAFAEAGTELGRRETGAGVTSVTGFRWTR